MVAETKKTTAGISLTDDDMLLIERLKVKTKIFQTSALFRHALQVLAKTEGVNGRAR
jgi:hypothetical protein